MGGETREARELLDEACLRLKDLEARSQDLGKANRMKDEFLAMVSHELRTPLSALMGWCQILVSRADEPGLVARGLQAMRRNGEALRRLVDDILDVSRIITGKLKVDLQRTELEQVVRASLELARPAAASKGVRLEASFAQDCVVLGDAQRLQQVVDNLLSNAVKFTLAHGRVEVILERRGGEASLTVRDDGCGISPGDLPHVFDRFRQADCSSTRNPSGLGLGLAIARHIVEAHGGRITARSDGPGRGATFSVDLPAKPLSIPPMPPLRPRGGRGQSLVGRRLLFVDDEPDALECIAIALGAMGAKVRTATSVDEAMELLGTFAPDAIVSDIAMPRRDGYDLIRGIRSLPSPLCLIPTIALTAQARADDARRALRAGFARHLAKPVDSDVLAHVIATL
jgi:CheY-like chemotaxis protein